MTEDQVYKKLHSIAREVMGTKLFFQMHGLFDIPMVLNFFQNVDKMLLDFFNL
jgi:hypothetical protein